jgi:hypothetical protein
MSNGSVTVTLRAVLLVFFCSIRFGMAADALILISPESAGPNVPAAFENHLDWILWPAAYPANSKNGLLSLTTGLDWVGSSEFLQFRSIGSKQWWPIGGDQLAAIGYFKARSRFLKGWNTTLVADALGNSTDEALLLDVQSDKEAVRGISAGTIFGSNNLVVSNALSWDSAIGLSKICRGRCAIVEYPPPAETRWSRYWRVGRGWPPNNQIPLVREIGIPGLVPARELVNLLRDPASVRWVPAKMLPHETMQKIAFVSPLILSCYIVSIFLSLTFVVMMVKRELSSDVLRVVLLGLLAFPALDVVSGSICSRIGQGAWLFVTPTIALILLATVALIETMLGSKIRGVDLKIVSISMFGVGALVLCGWNGSDFSGLFSGSPGGVSFELAGAVGGYLVGCFSGCARFGFRALIVVLVTGGMSFLHWKSGANFSIGLLIPGIALAATTPINPFSMIVVAGIPLIGSPRVDHLCWKPFGLLSSYRDLSGFNLSPYFSQIFSASMAVTICGFSILCLNSIGFANHHFQVRYRNSPLCRNLANAILLTLAMSLVAPLMLDCALSLALGLALVLSYLSVE